MGRQRARDDGDGSSGNSVVPQGFVHIGGHLSASAQAGLVKDVEAVVAAAPLYQPTMPRTGKPFSVMMTNCGPLGWVSDKDGGYRYQGTHPLTGRPWPEMPPLLLELWRDVAGYAHPPEACLINYYTTGSRLGSHVDADEQDAAAPVLSISLGDESVFHVGGERRSDPKVRLTLRSGDVVVLGERARHAYHGLDRIIPGTSSLLAGGGRYNLTLRRVNIPPLTGR